MRRVTALIILSCAGVAADFVATTRSMPPDVVVLPIGVAVNPTLLSRTIPEVAAPIAILAALDTPAADQWTPSRSVERPVLIPQPIPLVQENALIGSASFYDKPQKTASGENYDPDAFTAAVHLDFRHQFGGIKYGALYRPAYGLGEYAGKKVIVRFNDVGPLPFGRKFDLSRAAMAHFDPSLIKGVLPDFKMTPLPLGRAYSTGPVIDAQLADMGLDDRSAGFALANIENRQDANGPAGQQAHQYHRHAF
jgi:rare lipoprotein A